MKMFCVALSFINDFYYQSPTTKLICSVISFTIKFGLKIEVLIYNQIIRS